jgi:hypothetical protein
LKLNLLLFMQTKILSLKWVKAICCGLAIANLNPIFAQTPSSAAPTPTSLAANVISLFSNAYTNVNVDTWRTSWSSATLTDTTIAGNDVKRYSNLDFVGVETTGANFINASGMDNFNIHVWTANATTFRVKLVDFGADAAYGGGDDKEHEIPFTPTANAWNVYNIPLTDFTNLTTKNHIAQIIFSALPTGTASVYIDNVYFSKADNAPTTAAPTPTALQANVISMFSNAYTNVNVDTWRTSWSSASLTDIQVAGNDVKRYSTLDFVGIETTGANFIDASGMDNFNFDVWTPNVTTFKVKLVDFGADAAYGGGDDTEHELSLSPTANSWNTFNLKLSDFTNLAGKKHIAQLIFAGLPTGAGVVYLDNIYYSKAPSSIEGNTVALSQLYPNPAKQFVRLSAASNIETVEVYNALGQVVYSAQPKQNQVEISTLTFAKGVYTIKAMINGAISIHSCVVE